MNQAAMHAYQTLREQGSQRAILDQLQTRDHFNDLLHYHAAEQRLDRERQSP